MDRNRLSVRLGAFGLALSTLAFAGCDDDDEGTIVTGTFGSAIQSAGLTTLADLLDQSGLASSLDSGGPFTVFGPTDAAFDALPAGFLEGLSEQELSDFLTYHVALGDFSLEDLSMLDQIETLGGMNILISQIGDTLFLNDAPITSGSLASPNGQIFPLPGVLTLPQSLSDTLASRGFNTMAAALTAAGLDGELAGSAGVTVLAPTDEAFAALPDGLLDDLLLPANQAELESLLRYHVVDGSANIGPALVAGDTQTADGRVIHFGLDEVQSPRVNQQRLSTVNVPTTNGILHGVDAVLAEPVALGSSLDGTLFGLGTQITGVFGTIEDEAEDFTAFLPTNDSLVQLVQTQPNLANFLIAPENLGDLTTTILNHFVSGVQSSQDVLATASFASLAGDGNDVAVTNDGTGTAIGGLALSTTDLVATNGIIHLIEGLIVPATIDVPEEPATLLAVSSGDESSADVQEFVARLKLAAAEAMATPEFAEGLAAKVRGRASRFGGAFGPGALGTLGLTAIGSADVVALGELASWSFDLPVAPVAPLFATEALAGAWSELSSEGTLRFGGLPLDAQAWLVVWSEATPVLEGLAAELLVPLADGSNLMVLRVHTADSGSLEARFESLGSIRAELAVF